MVDCVLRFEALQTQHSTVEWHRPDRSISLCAEGEVAGSVPAYSAHSSLTAPIVCSAQLFLASSDAAAHVISLNGQVSVLRDGKPWALNIGD